MLITNGNEGIKLNEEVKDAQDAEEADEADVIKEEAMSKESSQCRSQRCFRS